MSTPADTWQSPQTVIAIGGLLIVAGTIAAVFTWGDPPTINQTVGAVMGSISGAIFGFYFGSSAGSQRKDAAAASPQPPSKDQEPH